MADLLNISSIALKGLGAFSGFIGDRTEASIIGYNNNVLGSNAQAHIQAAETSVRQQEIALEKRIGSAVAAYAKAGIRFSGAPVDVATEIAKAGRHDILMTRLNAIADTAPIRSQILNNSLKASRLRTQSISRFSDLLVDVGGTIIRDKYAEDTKEAILNA